MTAAVFKVSLVFRFVASSHFKRRERKCVKTLDGSLGTGLGNGQDVPSTGGVGCGLKFGKTLDFATARNLMARTTTPSARRHLEAAFGGVAPVASQERPCCMRPVTMLGAMPSC